MTTTTTTTTTATLTKKNAIKVEIYKVPDEMLKALDRLEGHPNWYIRTKVKTLGGDKIEVYHMPDEDNTVSSDDYMQNIFEKEDDNIRYYDWKRS